MTYAYSNIPSAFCCWKNWFLLLFWNLFACLKKLKKNPPIMLVDL